MMATRQAKIGTVIHGTMRAQDLIPAFLAECEYLGLEGGPYGKGDTMDYAREVIARCDDDEEWDAEAGLDELTCDLADMLEEAAPPYVYFGSHEGDGSDYGFWPHVDFMRDPWSYGVQSGPDYRLADEGEAEYFEVNDHGNGTFYAKQPDGTWLEVWSVV